MRLTAGDSSGEWRFFGKKRQFFGNDPALTGVKRHMTIQKTFRIKPRHIKGLRALVEQGTFRKAAEASGIPERTLYRWVHDIPTLRQELQFLSQEAWGQGLMELEASAPAAVRSLRRVMDSFSATPGERSQAARALLQYATKIAQLRVEEGKVKPKSE